MYPTAGLSPIPERFVHATREEIAETVFIAAALRAGGAVGHGLLTMKLFDKASNRLEKDPQALDRVLWE